jgi:hypothetical protein
MQCEMTRWRGRRACVLGNETIVLTHLTGGGHIADLHFRKTNKTNPLWVPRWKTMEPFDFDPRDDIALYGPPAVGRLLSGIVGHSLCLDLFGTPSEEEIRTGGTLHGEAGVLRWNVRRNKQNAHAELHFSVALPRSALSFSRSLLLRRGETVVYVRETVKNQRPVDQFFQWQQHATVGMPFLSRDCVVAMPGGRGKTFPSGYDGRELLKSNTDFIWPYAPRFDGGRVDLRHVLTTPGRGFVAGVQIVPDRAHAFVSVSNPRSQLAIGYCFRRKDFPWIAIWEENAARKASPWKGRERTRALEFGKSPLPLGRADNFGVGKLFGLPTLAHVPARGTQTACYAIFLARLPSGTRSIRDVVVGRSSIDLIGSSGKLISSLPAGAIHKYLD